MKNKGFALPPYVTPEMCNPEFWVSKEREADKVLLDFERIKELNEAFTKIEGVERVDITKISEHFNGVELAAKLSVMKLSQSEYFINGKPVGIDFLNDICENIKNANVDESMSIRYGFTVNYCEMKDYPCDEYLSDSDDDREWDVLMFSGVVCNEPIVIYFFTNDKKFAYVRCALGVGWVKSTDIAICKSREEWLDNIADENILVVTANKIFLEASGVDNELSQKLLTMGTVLKLKQLNSDDTSLINRVPWNNYVVSIPCRACDGSFYEKTAMIPMNRDVHVGYLDLTIRNIVTQAFKCLGDIYGWGGMLSSTDCSGFTHNVYRCFGFVIPRNASWQEKMPVNVNFIGKLSNKEKICEISKAKPGSLLHFDGHIMFYIGKVDDKLYTINCVSSMINPENINGGFLRIRGVVINDLSVIRGNGHSWLDDMNSIITIWE